MQFRAILTSQVRNISPSLSSVTISNITAQASHFFTTNFVLPSRPIKGLLTANTYLPVSSDIVFGINTKNSTDFGDYQIIEPNRLFTSVQGQFGTNLRVGAKLLSPGIPQLQATNDPGDPYDASSFVCTIDFDYENIGIVAENYDFRIRLYSDPYRTQLSYTFFTGNDQTGWSYQGGPDNVFPATGLPFIAGETLKVYFTPGSAINQNRKWYITVEALNTTAGSEYETVLSNMSFICPSCYINYDSGLIAKYYTNLSSLTEMPVFGVYTPAFVTNETVVNFTESSSSWVSSDVSATLTNVDNNFAIRFTGHIYVAVAGSYGFAIESADGSKLLIDSVSIIDNDGVHVMTKEYGSATLAAGWHSIEIQYFNATSAHGLILYWETPGASETVVPPENLGHSVVDEY
jgi:hypothetical protein